MEWSDFPSAAALQALPEPYMVVEAETRRILLANEAMARLTGYSVEQFRTMGPTDLLTPSDDTRLALAYEHLSPGTITRRSWIGRRSDGSQILVDVVSVPMIVGGQTVVQMLIHDLTDTSAEAGQQALLAMAHERLAVSVEYDDTLTTILGLAVPQLADRCTVALFDDNGGLIQVADSAAAVPSGGPSVDAAGAPAAGSEVPAAASEVDAETATFDLRAHGRELGCLTMYRRPPRTWDADARSLATALARRVAQAVDTALLWHTAQRELTRRAALHRISRAFAESEPGSDRVMQVLLEQCMAMLGCDHGGIALWDASSGRLVQVYSSTGRSNGLIVGLADSLSGVAARSQRTAISNDYQREFGRVTPGGRFGAHAGVATPLLHEGRLIGVLSVGTRQPGRRFGADDAEAIELLAGMAAAMLGTLERAQLQAVTLAARELAHRLNNDLALAVGTIDLLRGEPGLTDELRGLIQDAADGLDRVGEQMQQLQQLVRFHTRETPVGPALDLDRSRGPAGEPF